jgi:hypothetical protein
MTDQQQWPVIGEMAGVEVVTIPRAVYEGLLQRALNKPSLDPSGRRDRSRIGQDQELALLVDACLDQRMIYSAVRAACIERFGIARAPSVQAISRWFRNRL